MLKKLLKKVGKNVEKIVEKMLKKLFQKHNNLILKKFLDLVGSCSKILWRGSCIKLGRFMY